MNPQTPTKNSEPITAVTATGSTPKVEVEDRVPRIVDPAPACVNWQQRLAAFPEELKQRPIWCVWRLEERDGKQTKVPLAVCGFW